MKRLEQIRMILIPLYRPGLKRNTSTTWKLEMQSKTFVTFNYPARPERDSKALIEGTTIAAMLL